jgi:hypothetical protein
MMRRKQDGVAITRLAEPRRRRHWMQRAHLAQTGGRRRASFPPPADWPCKRCARRVLPCPGSSHGRAGPGSEETTGATAQTACTRSSAILSSRPSTAPLSPRPARLDSRIARSHGLSRRPPATLVPCPRGQENLYRAPPSHASHTTQPAHTATMSSKEQQPNDAEKNIEIWKVKKLIKRLEAARGNGTSMISLIIRE